MFWYIDPLYLTIFFVTLLISIGAQVFVSSTYKKWSKVRNGSGLTGAQIGDQILRKTGLGTTGYYPDTAAQTAQITRLAELQRKGVISGEEFDAKKRQLELEMSTAKPSSSSINFQLVPGRLTDHYDPRSHTVRMSEGTAKNPSIASMAIVAHELGHAQQHEQNSIFIKMRNVLLPAVKISPQIAFFCIFIGLFFNILGLFYVGIIFYGLMVIFAFVTLPVEIDASRRAIVLLRESGLMVAPEDEQGSKSVLTAAASTYIAAAVTALLQLLYYISIGRRRR
jgi:Zn-dependent membrane protease YugP